jgi:hypothetical protein
MSCRRIYNADLSTFGKLATMVCGIHTQAAAVQAFHVVKEGA